MSTGDVALCAEAFLGKISVLCCALRVLRRAIHSAPSFDALLAYAEFGFDGPLTVLRITRRKLAACFCSAPRLYTKPSRAGACVGYL